jgi:hypothetical protein
MKIFYIPLGSFCYPKMIIRDTKREISESLPFDFNSSPHLPKVTEILKELYDKKTYNIELKEILQIYSGNGNELSVSEKNMYIVHFFKDYDLKGHIDKFPAPATLIKDNVVNDVKNKFKKRFSRLYDIMNDKDNLLCFLRIENYKNYGWSYELVEFTKIISLFKNPNKFLIYSQELIDEELDFKNTSILNYNYSIPILFCKHYFYDLEMINNKHIFIKLLESFENIINNTNVINIKNNNIVEKYYIDHSKLKIFKLTNINYFSQFHIYNNNLYINNVISGYDEYIKNEYNIYEKSI